MVSKSETSFIVSKIDFFLFSFTCISKIWFVFYHRWFLFDNLNRQLYFLIHLSVIRLYYYTQYQFHYRNTFVSFLHIVVSVIKLFFSFLLKVLIQSLIYFVISQPLLMYLYFYHNLFSYCGIL